MPRKLPLIMNIIDLESTCWEKSTDRPPGQSMEIIEVGITTLDISKDTPEIGEKRSILVRPETSTLSEFCTKLTTITPELIEAEGVHFETALNILKKEYKSRDRTWASWGDFDRKMFQSQCEEMDLIYNSTFGPRHINLKNLYSIMNHLPYELGMAGALEREGIPLEGTHHRGHDDAQNIAKIASRMFTKRQEAIDYSQMKLESFELPNPGPGWKASPDFKVK